MSGQSSSRESLFPALDLPLAAQPLQTAYWTARREWGALDAAYHTVLRDLLKRIEEEQDAA